METGLVVAHSSSRPAWGVGGGLLPTPWPFGVSSAELRETGCLSSLVCFTTSLSIEGSRYICFGRRCILSLGEWS